MANDSVRQYLDEIATTPLLTIQEEICLNRHITEAQALEKLKRPLTKKEKFVVRRANRARRRFIEGNLKLVVYIAKKYISARTLVHLELMDLVQEGSLGLMKAVERFDSTRGYKFSTYAYWWIKQSINRAIDNKERVIRRSSTANTIAARMQRSIGELSVMLGASPTKEQLAEYIGVSYSEIDLYMTRGRGVISLDTCDSGTHEIELVQMIPDPSSLCEEDRDEKIQNELQSPIIQTCMSKLSMQERVFIAMRYGLNKDGICHSLNEIGNTSVGGKPKVSKERARQIINNGINKLRLYISHQGLLSSNPQSEEHTSNTMVIYQGGQVCSHKNSELHEFPAPQCAA